MRPACVSERWPTRNEGSRCENGNVRPPRAAATAASMSEPQISMRPRRTCMIGWRTWTRTTAGKSRRVRPHGSRDDTGSRHSGLSW